MPSETIYSTPNGAVAVENWYQKALYNLPVPYESRYVDTCWGRTHVLITGNPNGQPLMLLHGLNNNALIWRPQLIALQKYRIYAVDIVGQPGRSALKRPSLAGGDYARWMLDILNALKLEAVTMIGLSLGGYLTLKIGSFAPERVERAVLISPAGLWPIRPETALKIASSILSPSQASYRRLLYSIFTTPGVPKRTDIDDAVSLLEIIHRHERPAQGLREAMETVLPGIPLSALEARRFVAPTLVLIGDRDMLFPADAVVKRAARVLPNLAAAEVMPRAGHALIYEYPDRVNERILRFLNTGK
ncbi:MAG: alpha/beta hydrolase [Anaerolineae bacterium]